MRPTQYLDKKTAFYQLWIKIFFCFYWISSFIKVDAPIGALWGVRPSSVCDTNKLPLGYLYHYRSLNARPCSWLQLAAHLEDDRWKSANGGCRSTRDPVDEVLIEWHSIQWMATWCRRDMPEHWQALKSDSWSQRLLVCSMSTMCVYSTSRSLC